MKYQRTQEKMPMQIIKIGSPAAFPHSINRGDRRNRSTATKKEEHG